ncbi:hypothetical protein Fmac_020270 [Flemingia macrophylla]|uniref:Uncharacterized protein n=1 Tax=Flemingia macrophylla TaxID=520843 RepID=A0ABD1LTM2_9FABA
MINSTHRENHSCNSPITPMISLAREMGYETIGVTIMILGYAQCLLITAKECKLRVSKQRRTFFKKASATFQEGLHHHRTMHHYWNKILRLKEAASVEENGYDYRIDDGDSGLTSYNNKLLVIVDDCIDKGYTVVNLGCPNRPK